LFDLIENKLVKEHSFSIKADLIEKIECLLSKIKLNE
jgi:hypothetical protein